MTLEMIYEEMGDEDKRFQVSGQVLLLLPVSEHGSMWGAVVRLRGTG